MGKKPLPKGIFPRGTILFFLKKEVARAWRYKVPFSTITLTIVNIMPKKPVPPGTIKKDEVYIGIMERLAKIMRETDLIGFLDENKILMMLPMTNENGANCALRRFLEALHAKPLTINNIPLNAGFAAVCTSFHRDKTSTVQAFLKAIESELSGLLKSLKISYEGID